MLCLPCVCCASPCLAIALGLNRDRAIPLAAVRSFLLSLCFAFAFAFAWLGLAGAGAGLGLGWVGWGWLCFPWCICTVLCCGCVSGLWRAFAPPGEKQRVLSSNAVVDQSIASLSAQLLSLIRFLCTDWACVSWRDGE
ncbi:hypothetical protein Mapa_010684 [Marchantia paleacea]|nr:hypothetical protein Mapa_010684 [Marchantia paleacea]